MEVKNNSGEVYTTTCKTVISRRLRSNHYQPGMEVNIKIDPRNEKNVVMDASNYS
jgi:hypothetical protein